MTKAGLDEVLFCRCVKPMICRDADCPGRRSGFNTEDDFSCV